SGSEVGPFLSIEQAALSQLVSTERRTLVFAWYNLAGSFATATGALTGGIVAQSLQNAGVQPLGSYRVIVIGYAVMGVVLSLTFALISPAVEAQRHETAMDRSSSRASVGIICRFYNAVGLARSGPVVFKLSALFSLDAFAGGLILQSLMAYWFHV